MTVECDLWLCSDTDRIGSDLIDWTREQPKAMLSSLDDSSDRGRQKTETWAVKWKSEELCKSVDTDGQMKRPSLADLCDMLQHRQRPAAIAMPMSASSRICHGFATATKRFSDAQHSTEQEQHTEHWTEMWSELFYSHDYTIHTRYSEHSAPAKPFVFSRDREEKVHYFSG